MLAMSAFDSRTKYIRDGSILSHASGDSAVCTVQAMLAMPVHDSRIKDLSPGKNHLIAMPPAEIILKACYQGEMNEMRLQELFEYFCRFPPVTIRLVPLHTLGVHFPSLSRYLQLHGQSVLHGLVSLKEYLGKDDTPKASREAVQLLTLLYILGLIVPAPKAATSEKNVLGRLMKRIRGI
jgi:hypothetical protein